MVLEVAVAAGGATVVTYNVADFAGSERLGVRAVEPWDFLTEIGET